MKQSGYEKIMLSLYCPALWRMEEFDIQRALRLFNEEAAQIRQSDPAQYGVFGAIDVDQPLFAISEIDYCINTLKLDGIMISTNLLAKSFSHILDKQLMEHIAVLKVPVLLHPRDAEGLPLINENYMDSIFFMAKVF